MRSGADNQGRKTVVVLGAPRGGTSLVAGVLRELGLDLGSRLGRNHEDPKLLTKNIDKLRSMIDAYNNNKAVWGFKIPHIIFRLPKIELSLINPHYLVVIRNPISAANSHERRSKERDFNKGLRLTTKYYLEISEYFRCRPDAKVLYLEFEKVCANPSLFVREICNFIDIFPAEESINNAISIVNPKVGYQDIKRFRWQVARAVAIPADADFIENSIDVNAHTADGFDKLIATISHKALRNVFFHIEVSAEVDVELLLDLGEGLNINGRKKVTLEAGSNFLNIVANSPIRALGMRIPQGLVKAKLGKFANRDGVGLC